MIQGTHFAMVLALSASALAQSPLDPAKPTKSESTSEEAVLSGPANAAAWDTLNQGFHDSDTDHRKKAIAAIGTIGALPAAVQMAEHGLQDKDTLAGQRHASPADGR